MRIEQDGMALWYGTPDAPAPSGKVEAAEGSEQAQVSVTVGMRPPSASNSVQVVYRVNGGASATVPGSLLTHDPHQQAQYFQAKLPPFHVGESVDYLVIGRAPGHQLPGPQQAKQFAASFQVVPDPPPESGSGNGSRFAVLHSSSAGAAGHAGSAAGGGQVESVATGRSVGLGSSIVHSPGSPGPGAGSGSSVPSPSGSAPAFTTGAGSSHIGTVVEDSPAIATLSGHGAVGGVPGFVPRIAGPISLQRIPSAIDPLSEAGGKVADRLLAFRAAAAKRFYLGIDQVRSHLQTIKIALVTRTLPGQLIGVLLQPDGSPAPSLQMQFDPSSVGSTRPKVTVVTRSSHQDAGSFHLSLPQGPALPDAGLSLTVHGANGNATVMIPASQIAANGLVGSITLPVRLDPLPGSIVSALAALLPASSPPASATPSSNGQHLHVVKLGEDDDSEICFKANSAVDKFPYGVFFRLVEPQTSIPHMAVSVPGQKGYYPIPSYASSSTASGGNGNVNYVNRIPIEQPLSVDGFRDQLMGVMSDGTITGDETVPMAGTLGLGYTLWMSQRWTFQGLALGDLVYSLALAPGEQQQVAIFERVDTATVQESEFFTEEEVENQAAQSDTSTQATFNSAFNELVNGGSQYTAHATSTSGAAGGAFSLGIISFGGGGSTGSTDSSGQTSQWLQGQRNTTQQAAESTHSAAQNQAAARRSAAHTSMRMATASESESVTTKVITNHNHTRALTLQYWEVLRLYDVATAIDGLTLTCLVPLQVVRFLPPGQTLTLSDPSLVGTRAQVMARYSSIIRHADVLAQALPRRFRYGLTLLQQFAADPTASVEKAGGVAEDVIQFTLSGTFLPCEDIYITAVTKRNTRVGPVKLLNSASIPQDKFASREELLAWLSAQRHSNNAVSLTANLALPASLNRSDIIGFEFSRSFREVDHTLISEEVAAVNALTGLFGNHEPPFLNSLLQATVGQAEKVTFHRTTVHITPSELESTLGGPLLQHFRAGIEEFDAKGNLVQSTAKGESYANDSLNGVELPAQPYPVPAVQMGPVLRFNQILEIEKMAQHVVRNTVTYSRAVWASMTPDERAILLEHYTIGVPSDGITDESQMVPLLNCVENRVLGFFGNSMMLPFLIPQSLADPNTGLGLDPAQLQNALLSYQQEAFVPPHSTIALPTRGVLGEAVLGRSPSAEKIDLTRFWNWADAPGDTAPAIAPVTVPTTTSSIAAGLTAPNTLTNLPPLINNILAPPTPDTSLLQALSKAAASQQDFSPDFTGAKQLADLVKGAQDTANSARSDALKANTQLVSQAMTTAGKVVSDLSKQAQDAQKQANQQAQDAQKQTNQQPQGPQSPGTQTPQSQNPLGNGTDGAPEGDATSAGADGAAGADAGAAGVGAGAGDAGAAGAGAGAADLGAGAAGAGGAEAGLASDAGALALLA